MEIRLLKQAQIDLEFWKASGNVKIQKRISKLLKDIQSHPFSGIGKPEPLTGDLRGKWSRRINDEHRIIYSVESGMICVYVLSMRYHYNK